MKFTSSLLLAAAVISFSACSETTTSETETSTTESAATETVSADPFATSTDSNQTATMPAETDASVPGLAGQPGAVSPASAPSPAAGASASGAGLNPAHGAPGHDCAIPVGAPLGSKPTTAKLNTSMPAVANQANAPQITTSPNMGTVSPVTSPPAGAVAAGMNPAHGAPGHDCAIPVGAPLKK